MRRAEFRLWTAACRLRAAMDPLVLLLAATEAYNRISSPLDSPWNLDRVGLWAHIIQAALILYVLGGTRTLAARTGDAALAGATARLMAVHAPAAVLAGVWVYVAGFTGWFGWVAALAAAVSGACWMALGRRLGGREGGVAVMAGLGYLTLFLAPVGLVAELVWSQMLPDRFKWLYAGESGEKGRSSG